MASPKYLTDLQTIALAESGDTYIELNAGNVYNKGGTPAFEQDYYIQGTGCWSQSLGTKTGLSFSLMADAGADISANFATNDVVFMWQVLQAGNGMDTFNNGGLRFAIAADADNADVWYVGGNDFGRNPYGGFQNVAVDPTLTVDDTIGAGAGGVWRYFGSVLNTLVQISKGSPHAVDAIRYGRGEFYIWDGEAGNYANFTGMASTNDGINARWGQFQETGGTFLWKGLMSFGKDASAVSFVDSNKTISIDNTPRTYEDFNRIEVNNTGSWVSWSNITLLSLTPLDPSGTLARGNIQIVDDASVEWNGCTFNGLNQLSFLTNSFITASIFNATNDISAGGGTFTNSVVQNSTVDTSTSAFIWNQATDPDGRLDGMEFIKGENDHHAIEFGVLSPTSITLRDWITSGFSASNGQASSTFHVKRTTGTVTINVVGGTGNFTYMSDGATVNIVIDPVTTEVTVLDGRTAATPPLENAFVRVEASNDSGDLPYRHAVTINRVGTDASVNDSLGHGLATNDYVIIRGADQTEYNKAYPVTVVDASTFTFSVVGDPATPATGNPIITGAVIYGYTGPDGKISDTRTWTNPQPIVGVARKSTTSPLFRNGPITGTISTTTGFTTTVLMQSDE